MAEQHPHDLIEKGKKYEALKILHTKAVAQNARFKKALEEISEGKGAYKMDPYEHARSCIEDMKLLATQALNPNGE